MTLLLRKPVMTKAMDYIYNTRRPQVAEALGYDPDSVSDAQETIIVLYIIAQFLNSLNFNVQGNRNG